MNWYLGVFKKYAEFKGRARRKEYWMFILFNAIVAVLLSILSLISGAFSILSYIYSLAILIPTIALTVRRLHDQDKSGGWYFICFVPIIGAIWLLVLMCTEGTRGTNRFGEDPKVQ